MSKDNLGLSLVWLQIIGIIGGVALFSVDFGTDWLKRPVPHAFYYIDGTVVVSSAPWFREYMKHILNFITKK